MALVSRSADWQTEAPRNPFLHIIYQGEKLHRGYIIGTQGLELGLTSLNTAGFAFIKSQRNEADTDWLQPIASLGLPDGFNINLPILIDTGLDEMLLGLAIADRPPTLANDTQFPTGVPVAIAAPPSPSEPVLQYSFVTGDASNPMAPSAVEWRDREGINTGRKVLAGADYLYNAAAGLVGFRIPPGD